MKIFCRRIWPAAVLWAVLCAGTVRADDESELQKRAAQTEAAFQTVFYAVLEGCFTVGLTDADVDQILRREEPQQGRIHFIYSCPICTATEEALETYRTRNKAHTKLGGKRTFGKGLSSEMHDRLYSEDLKVRLGAVHDLEESWVSRRIESLRLNPEELARTQEELRVARDRGMTALQSFIREGWMNQYAPGYQQGDECALCNAAAGMKLKLASPQP